MKHMLRIFWCSVVGHRLAHPRQPLSFKEALNWCSRCCSVIVIRGLKDVSAEKGQ